MSAQPENPCPAGSHDFSQWIYEAAGSCNQQRRCKKCSTPEARTQHRSTEFLYLDDNSCEQARRCVRCGQDEQTRTEHTWGSWSPERVCVKSRKCSRCEQVERLPQAGLPHDLSEWQAITYGKLSRMLLVELKRKFDRRFLPSPRHPKEWAERPSCFQQRHCLRTGCVEIENRIVHVVKAAKTKLKSESPCTQIKVCPACQEIIELVEHQWGEAKLASKCAFSRRNCRRCNAEERSKVDPPQHDWDDNWRPVYERCIRLITCRRCDTEDQVPLNPAPHHWGEWTLQDCYNDKQVCKKCGAEQTRAKDNHDIIGNPLTGRTCRRCGKTWSPPPPPLVTPATPMP